MATALAGSGVFSLVGDLFFSILDKVLRGDRTTRRVVRRLESRADWAALATLLQTRPDLENFYFPRATDGMMHPTLWPAPVYALVFASRRSPRASTILGHVMPIKAWRGFHERLGEQDMLCLAG